MPPPAAARASIDLRTAFGATFAHRILGAMGDQSQTGVGALLRATGFRRLLIGQGVSGLGDWVATLALIALASDLTNSQTAVAVVLVIRLVPPIFAAPIGGVLADRMDRRTMMVSCDLTRGALI